MFRALHVDTRLNRIAAVLPPPSLPANSQFLRPRATGFTARSLALLSIDRYPAPVNRFNATQFERA